MSDVPKFRLRKGLQPTIIVVTEPDGRRHNERVEPGRIYEGEKYLQWAPRILTLIESKVTVEALKEKYVPPVVGKRLLRRRLRPPMEVTPEKPASLDVQATVTKKHESETDKEAERGKPPEPEKPVEEAQPPELPPEPDPEPEDEQADYEEPEITSKTDLRRMKKEELLELALYHDYDVSDDTHTKGDLVETLIEHYGV